MTDPIVKEVRKARSEHSARFGNDLNLIMEDLLARQKRHGARLVRLPARRIPIKPIDRTS